MATLELRHLGKIYPNGEPAVRELDVSIADGEFFVLVGPSGCGKTTVLRMVAGLEEPTTGDVLIDGEVATDLAPQARDVAMAFQHGALYPHMTVGDNIGFSLRISGVHKAEQAARVLEVARMLDLEDVLDRFPSKISGGQQQRVAMGRALIREPRLLLMDEPMSNLDAKLRTAGRAEILAIQDRLGLTTLYVTHDQVEAMALADRVGVMRDGRLVQCGTPTEVYERPVDLFVARFMGSPPMNVLLATVVDDEGVLALAIGSHRVRLPAAHLPDRLAAGDRVAVGIRPEDFRHDPDDPAFTLSLDHHELLGSEQLVHAALDAHGVDQDAGSVRLSATATSPITALLGIDVEVDLWRPLRLSVDTSRLYFFDLESGAPLR